MRAMTVATSADRLTDSSRAIRRLCAVPGATPAWSARSVFLTTGIGFALSASISAAATVHADNAVDLARPQPPGTVILLKRGQVYQGPITVTSSGTATAPIRIAAYGTGPAPIIKGRPTIYADALTVTGSYVQIDGLQFSDTNRAGVQVTKTASHISITGSEMTRVGLGVSILGHDVVVSHNMMHDLTMVRNTPTDHTSPATVAATSNDDYGANGVLVSGSNVEVSFNRIVKAKAPSFDYGNDGGAVELYALKPFSDVDIHDNWTEDCQGFLEAGGNVGGSIANVRVYRNVSLNNGNFLDLHNGGGSFAVKWSGFHAFDNTVINEANAPKEMAAIFLDNANASGIEIDHNIVWLNDGDSVWKQPTAGYHHDNAFYLGSPKSTHLFNDWTMTLARGEVMADPLFVDRAHRNLALKPGSLAQGMGAIPHR